MSSHSMFARSSPSLVSTSGTAAARSPISALEAHGIGYTTARGKTLLAGVSVRLEPGRLLAVLGPNGAGKTTLLRLLMGELLPTTGEITLGGRRLNGWSSHERARRLAVLPQQSTLNAALTGLEVALLGRSPHPTRGDGPADLAAAHEALALMDAAHLAARLYPSLSGGEKSRVQAARVLAQIWEPSNVEPTAVGTPRYLLLDEPTAALDCAHQHHLLSRVRELARSQNLGVLAILHDLNLAAQYADELLVLKAGHTADYGLSRDVFRSALLSDVFGLNLMVIPHPVHSWPLAVPVLSGGDLL